MAYSPKLVQIPFVGVNKNNNTGGFPVGAFDNFLLSFWFCAQNENGVVDTIAFNNFYSLCQISVVSTGNLIHVALLNNLVVCYTADYALPSGANLYRSNLIVSANQPNSIVQVYLNDVPLTTANAVRYNSDPFFIGTSTFWNSWSTYSAINSNPPGGIGDVFAAPPADFFDLTNVTNRRKFINADLTAVDLQPNAASVLGTPPPIFLTVNTGIANDYATNYGSGGAWSIPPSIDPLAFQGNLCLIPPPPPQPGAPTWTVTSSLDNEFPGAVGDVWANNSYVDFDNPNVRAAFENADGTWLWLGTNGERPTLSSPLLFLTVQTGDPPADILTGYGQSGAQSSWFLVNQGVDPTTGQPYPAMSFDQCEATLPNNLELTDIQVITTTTQLVPHDDLITLRWSDDAGASWSNGLLRSLGAPGEYFTTPSWYRLGMSRNRIIELSWSGARAEALQGCFVEVTIAAT